MRFFRIPVVAAFAVVVTGSVQTRTTTLLSPPPATEHSITRIELLGMQTVNTEYAGLRIEGVDDRARAHLVARVGKCKTDSRSFRHILEDVAARTRGTTKFVRLRAYWFVDGMIGSSDTLGEMSIDLPDLQVLPDPVHNGEYENGIWPEFDSIPGVPLWATTVCGWLGHEIAERLEDVVDGRPDRRVHHYQIASVKEDSVVWDYYRVRRDRKKDCHQKHGAHNDVLVEIGTLGVERFHQSRDRAFFQPDGTIMDFIPSGRLAYVEYHAGMTFPGRVAGSRGVCSPEGAT